MVKRMSTVSMLILVVVGTLLSWTVIEAQPAMAPVVRGLECGEATGSWTVESNEYLNRSVNVAVFHSIPYAEPPVGDLRWRAPKPNKCWTGNYNATSYLNYCVQPGGGGAEDCLYLHVHVPEAILHRTNKSQLFPVLYYIHGGSLMTGAGQFEPFSHFAGFAGDKEGVIAVTVNYRLNTFGFFANEALEEADGTPAGNYGILDQLLGLHWVQKNIRAFGGDAQKVTLAGQSSGGTSIFALMASPKSKGLFRAAWSLSGSPNITMNKESKYQQDAVIVQTLGCSGLSSKTETAACLRNQSAQTLSSAFPPGWWTPGIFNLDGLTPGGRNFDGLVYVDGVILTHSFREAVQIGLNGNVTLIMSACGQEDNLVSPHVDVTNYTADQWLQYLHTSVFANWGPQESKIIADNVYFYYSEEMGINPQLAYDSVNADYGIICANDDIAMQALNVSRHSKPKFHAPIYVGVSQWPPENPNNNGVESYSYHTWDYRAAINDWWGYSPQPADYEMGHLLRHYWYHLMVQGDLKGFTAYGPEWKAYNEAPDFPETSYTFVWNRPDRYPFFGTMSRKNYKRNVCDMWRGFGFGESYWWCD